MFGESKPPRVIMASGIIPVVLEEVVVLRFFETRTAVDLLDPFLIAVHAELVWTNPHNRSQPLVGLVYNLKLSTTVPVPENPC